MSIRQFLAPGAMRVAVMTFILASLVAASPAVPATAVTRGMVTRASKPLPPHAPAIAGVTPKSSTKSSSIWVLVNKQRPLKPKSYRPSKLTKPAVALAGRNVTLRREAAIALAKMAKAAKKSTHKTMTLVSAYRSYRYQKSLYAGYKRRHGKKYADTYSARAGYSEHQTGLAADIGQRGSSCALRSCFGATKTGKWASKNAWKYGFILRYPKAQRATTGFAYEPWHFRYVGPELAKYMHVHKISTLEHAFRAGKAPTY